MAELRDAQAAGTGPIVISGCIGPQDDAYGPRDRLTAAQAQKYHATQIATFADTATDMVTALTLTYPEEAVGIARGGGGRDPGGDLIHRRD